MNTEIEELHELKTWPKAFQAIWDGMKTYEIRKADRPFKVGDQLRLNEYDTSRPIQDGPYTGRYVMAIITYMTEPGQWGLPEDVCVLGLGSIVKSDDWEKVEESLTDILNIITDLPLMLDNSSSYELFYDPETSDADKLDQLFDTMDSLFELQEWDIADDFISDIDVSRLSIGIMIGLVVITRPKWAADHLPSRPDLVSRVEEEIRFRDPARVEKLLGGVRDTA